MPTARGTRIPVLVIYDISHDGTRAKVADVCLDYGLDRIQYSAFAGELTRTHQEEMWLRIKRRVGKHAAKIFIVPMASDNWARRLVLEQGEPIPATREPANLLVLPNVQIALAATPNREEPQP